MKRTFATATALGLLLGTAYAGSNNQSYVNQTGSFNQATIDQSAGSQNQAGSATQAIKQLHTATNSQATMNNVLSIVQSGTNNTVGLGTNSNTFLNAPGVVQTQGYTGPSSYAAPKNTMEITQSSGNNAVGAVSQFTATHAGDNKLVIVQRGAGNNTVGSVSQYRTQTTQNIAEIDQAGQGNTIARVEQYVVSYGGSLGQEVNLIDVTVTGNNNGTATALAGAAAASGAKSSTLIQGDQSKAARLAYIGLNISGNNNEFGVTQYGLSNTVGMVTISGSGNQLGVNQNGSRNALALSTVAGAGNNFGLDQDGDDNKATLNVSGDYNGGGSLAGAALTLASGNGLVSGLIKQDGINNQATLAISNSNLNQFAFLQRGNDNVINGDVSGAGSNSATHVQIGNNNSSTFSQSGGGNIVAVNQ